MLDVATVASKFRNMFGDIYIGKVSAEGKVYCAMCVTCFLLLVEARANTLG